MREVQATRNTLAFLENLADKKTNFFQRKVTIGENSSDEGWIEKHMVRHEWLKTNLGAVGKVYNVDLSGFTVKSFFVTNEEMLTPHLRKQTLPLPFITLYDLEKDGFSVLEKNYDHQLKK